MQFRTTLGDLLAELDRMKHQLDTLPGTENRYLRRQLRSQIKEILKEVIGLAVNDIWLTGDGQQPEYHTASCRWTTLEDMLDTIDRTIWGVWDKDIDIRRTVVERMFSEA